MRIIGIDYGDARTGIAISDALGWTAQPVGQYASWNEEKLVEIIGEKISHFKPEKIVLGFPKNILLANEERRRSVLLRNWKKLLGSMLFYGTKG